MVAVTPTLDFFFFLPRRHSKLLFVGLSRFAYGYVLYFTRSIVTAAVANLNKPL